MRRMIFIILPCILSVLLLTSCYDAKEIDEQSNVLTIGVDQGISNIWRLTLQISSIADGPGGGGGPQENKGGGGEGGGYVAMSIDAPTFFEGIHMLESTIPRELNFEHMKYIVISEEMAQSGKLGDYMAPIRRFREIRNSSHVIVCQGSAEKFVNELHPFVGSTLSKSQELYFLEPSYSGFFPHTTLEDFYDGFKSDYRQPIAALAGVNNFESYQDEGEIFKGGFKSGGGYLAGQLPRKDGSSIEFFGTAVFNGDKMVGKLNGSETRLLLMGMGEFKKGFFNIPDPMRADLMVPINVNKANRKVKVKIEDGKPIIRLEVNLQGDILAIQSRINYESPKLKPVLEDAFEQYIKGDLDKVLARTKEMDSDIFRFGRTAAWNFKTIQEMEDYDWTAHYKSAEITTAVNFTIKRTGTMLSSSPLVGSEGRE